jgi:hypothetical protein
MSEKWKPEIGDAYYFFDSDFNVTIAHYDGYTWDEDRIAMGNCFNTKDAACDAAEKVKELLLSLHEPVTDCNQLPKLTAEVFNREDCPKWAKWAAVSNGVLIFADKEPTISEHGFWISADEQIKKYVILSDDCYKQFVTQKIERPAKLPDWCKVGEWVYDHHQHGYEKIIAIEDGSQYCIKTNNKGFFTVYYATENFVPARLRPYNAEEMRGLVGMVICNGQSIHFVTGYEGVPDGESMVCVNGCLYSANDLLLKGFTYDTRPCGRLEHLENGEWVN